MCKDKKACELSDNELEEVAGGRIINEIGGGDIKGTNISGTNMNVNQQKSFMNASEVAFMTSTNMKLDQQQITKAVKDAIFNCAQKDAILTSEVVLNQVVSQAMISLGMSATDMDASNYIRQAIKDQMGGLGNIFKN